MDWDRNRRFDDRRGGESYRPMNLNRTRRSPSRSYIRHARSPPRTRSPRLVADTWVPSTSRTYDRLRSRSPPALRRRSRSPSFYNRDVGQISYRRARSPRRFSPRRDERPRSPCQTLWRSRSPYSEGRSRDTSWGRTTPIRPRESSPPSQDFRFSKRQRFTSSTSDKYARADSPPRRGIIREYSSRPSIGPRARSPFQTNRERQQENTLRRRSISPSREVSSTHYSVAVSGASLKRMSPLADRTSLAPVDTQPTSYGRSSRPCHSTFNHDRTIPVRYKSPNPNEARHRPQIEEPAGKEQNREDCDMLRSTANQPHMGSVHMNYVHAPGNIPTQPKAYSASISQVPPSGPSHGPKSLSTQTRGPTISLLSAPTRPRGGSNLRDNAWAGALSRRGTTPAVAQGPPSGPRGSNFTPTYPGTEPHQHTLHRQSSITNGGFHRTQRLTNHLAGLCSIVPGGKAFPSSFELATEKRLSQLEVDKERLFDQATQKQKSKRSGIRDWDRLDRESSISTLKSELAEGHLQRITGGEGVHIGTVF